MGVPGSGDYPPQTPVTSLAFGPPTGPGQPGVLAAGVESPWEDMFSYRLNPDGTEKSMQHAGGSWLTLASAVASINGQQYAVYGGGHPAVMRSSSSSTLTPRVEFTRYTYPDTGAGDQPTGLTPLTRWDGDPGEPGAGAGHGRRDA